MSVNNASKETTGACSFMDTFSQVTATIGQNGRRGALMISIDCSHPDLMEFISIKNDLDRVTKANISVRITDDFMRAVINDSDWELSFTNGEETLTKTVKAKEVFKILCENNWNVAEPGILFWDRIDQYNLLSEDKEFRYAGVNPCAEEPLPNGGSCLLGSINLSAYVKDGKFDFNTFERDIYDIVEGMNEVLDQGLPLHPLQIQRDTVRDYRQIGIGVMGIADMLIKLGIRYDSDKAIELCDTISFMLADESIKASALLAKKYGTYPKYKKEILDSEFLKENTIQETYELVEKYGLRNSQLLTIAPTGSLSTMLGISGGIEPIFSLSYTRKTESLHGEDVYYKVFTPIAKEYMEEYGLTEEEELPNFFVTAQNIDPFKRVKMQGIWQKHIDASISSTVNLPESATVEEVEELYMSAWKHGLKGLTIFRDNCSRVGVLTLDDEKEEKEEKVKELARGEWEERPKEIIGVDRKVYTGCGKVKLHIKIVPSEKRIFDFYITNSTKGGCRHNIEANVICMSGMLRLGGKLDNVEQAFSGCGVCSSFTSARKTGKKISKGSSCPTAILNILKEVEQDLQNDNLEELRLIGYYDFHKSFKAEEEVVEPKEEKYIKLSALTEEEEKFLHEHGHTAFLKTYHKCPECGCKVVYTGGCMICPECGFTKCD